MTKIKLCGLRRPWDIAVANELRPDYIGFVFAKKSRRFVSAETALELKKQLVPGILAVGVFVREEPKIVAEYLERGIIDVAQLHGGEDEAYLGQLRSLTDRPLIKAFRMEGESDVAAAMASSADYVLLDSGSGGTGAAFDWTLLKTITRPYFLAGGLDPQNVGHALETYAPFAVDVSSGIETDGVKDERKMRTFVETVRRIGGKEDLS